MQNKIVLCGGPTLHIMLGVIGGEEGLCHVGHVGGAQVLATDKSAGEEIDFKYAIIGTALGFAISASFLALKICLIRKHLTDDDSSDLKSVHPACNDTIMRKKRPSSHYLSAIHQLL
ncbi:hypothetical protein H1C71_001303 [Ictidomys tridecemlineatus]|nr:hypothetical protein H1C71_001303 [Ictidomys tridecemlineatus]